MLDKAGELFSKALVKIFGSRNERLLREMIPAVRKVNSFEEQFYQLSNEKLRDKTAEFQKRLQQGETLDHILPEAFAAAREAARRSIGLRHFDVQLIGGMVLHQGKIAEMITGEGKTLVATAPAYLNALMGKGVHIVTVNDYLARRDRNWMGPVYETLGLTVGCIQTDMDSQARIKEYACNITYGTNNEYGFDYLRDNMKLRKEDLCQRELYYAIVDEVDSVLIDEARTPLIISGAAEESTEKYYTADKVVRRLQKGKHFELKEKEQLALLGEEGIEAAEKLVGVDSFYKGKNMDWPHHITQALRAHHFFKLDREYVIKDGEIIIVDEFTGRLQPGRRWSDGLHQAIEAKEGLHIREENQTLATVTLQNYFRLYHKLAGMTGTAVTEAMEFDKIYKLDVVVVPPNRTLIRVPYDDLIFGTEPEKFDAIVREIVFVHKTGRPLLVGTISIEKSERLSSMLERNGVPHQVLNAKQHEKEAQIIAKAGELAHVTIATNMAGRGTDIVLGKLDREQLLQHWQKHKLAPAKLKLEDSDFDEKTRRHWAGVFIGEELASRPLDEIEAKLREFWQSNQMMPLTLCSPFRPADMRNLADLVNKLEKADNPLSQYIWQRISPETHELLRRYDRSSAPSSELLIAFLKCLNNIAEDAAFYDAARFAHVILSDKAKRLSLQKPQGEALIRLNRLLLEEAYPQEIAPESVSALGGLHVVGTERHDARRIDNQLRGRAGRQGDPGSSRFYLSFEDDLLRKFAPPGMINLMKRLGLRDGQPIEHPWISRGIEKSQRRVEGYHFEIRKSLLEYDEVMDEQRKIIYGQRRKVLEGGDLKKLVWEMIEDRVGDAVDRFLPAKSYSTEWDFDGLCNWLNYKFTIKVLPGDLRDPSYRVVEQRILDILRKEYEEHANKFGKEAMSELERFVLLNAIDSKWKDHLHAMDDLRSGIGLVGYAQQDPKIEYKRSGYRMFDEMIVALKEEVSDLIFKLQIETVDVSALEKTWQPAGYHHDTIDSTNTYDSTASSTNPGSSLDRSSWKAAQENAGKQSVVAKPVQRVAPKIGRNDPCPCGSGKKYKKCCGKGSGE
jgi:preprotein translocase subunit SecA